MILLAVLSLAAGGAAVGLLAWALVLPHNRATARMGQLHAYGYSPRIEAAAAAGTPHLQRRGLLAGMAGALGHSLSRHLGTVREERLRTELMMAGLYGLTPHALLGYRVLAAGVLPALVVFGNLGLAPVITVLLAVMAGWMGWAIPLVLVRGRARRRAAEIDRGLPDLIDMLVVTVEAGLGLNASIKLAASRIPGPLGNELRLTMQEQRIGLASRAALENLLARADTPTVRMFVRAITQGEALGVSVGKILRNLADDVRKERRASAEEQAQKAPVKMLFPLIFMMFPAMFVVLLGPAVLQILDMLASN